MQISDLSLVCLVFSLRKIIPPSFKLVATKWSNKSKAAETHFKPFLRSRMQICRVSSSEMTGFNSVFLNENWCWTIFFKVSSHKDFCSYLKLGRMVMHRLQALHTKDKFDICSFAIFMNSYMGGIFLGHPVVAEFHSKRQYIFVKLRKM